MNFCTEKSGKTKDHVTPGTNAAFLDILWAKTVIFNEKFCI